MKVVNIKKNNWTTCLECQGQGKIMRGPSRKRLRIYRVALAEFETGNGNGSAPEYPAKNMDVCLVCKGSGLRSSDCSVDPDIDNYPHVAIIGGGIGGTALAVACLHRGIPFTLYERDDSFDSRSQGYGLTLQQASKSIAGLGILSLDGGITSTKHVVHNPDGRVIGEWGLRKWKKAMPEASTKRRNVHIARQSLRSALLEQLDNSCSVKWGYQLLDFSENEKELIDLSFQIDGKRESAKAGLLIGADGIRSIVRELLIGESQTPLQYLGCIVILGICSLKSLDGIASPLLDSETVFQTVNGHERIYMMPYDEDTIMWQLSFPLDEEEAKELSSKGAVAMKAEAIARLQKWHEPVPQILAATQESLITGYPVYDREILDLNLLNKAGNVTLLGDAAHPMSPFKGQGANQALLDALTLARMITTECGPDSKWREMGLRESLLSKFEKEMLERTASKVQDSARAVQLLHSDAVMHEGDEPRGRGFS